MSQKHNILLIKFGGSVITDKSKESTVNIPIIRQLVSELKSGLSATNNIAILAHGAGSFGHPQAAKYRTAEGYINDQSLIGFAQVKQSVMLLNKIIIDELINIGLPAIAFSPVSMIQNKNKTSIFLNSLESSLKHQFLPVVHGDCIFDNQKNWTIFSGETILNLIAFELLKKKYPISRIIEVSNSAGVYDDQYQTIPKIDQKNFSIIQKFLKNSDNLDVTGGMYHKVQEAMTLTRNGLSTYLISAKKNNLKAAILDKEFEGTVITT